MNFTPELNLYKWDKTDSKVDTITEMSKNADKIEQKFTEVDISLGEKATKTDLAKKTDVNGDHKGTWQGLTPSQVDVAVSAKIDELDTQLAQKAINIKTQSDLQKEIDKGIPITINLGSVVEVTSNLTIPPNIRLVVNHGGKFLIKAGITLTVDCQIDAGFYQIFDYADDTSIVTSTDTADPIIYRSNVFNTIKLEWFGAKGTGALVPPINLASVTDNGIDDTKAIKRAMLFAGIASQKFIAGQEPMAAIIVEARPSATYVVKGNNILGSQQDGSSGISVKFKGNGCVFYHNVQNITDSFIHNFNHFFNPSFEDFSVFPYGFTGNQGYFVNTQDTVGVTNACRLGRFKNLIVGELNYVSGYNVVFNILSDTMLDNIKVELCYISNFNKIWYCTNTEAVDWLFEKCYLIGSVNNATYFHCNCNLSGGLKINDCFTFLNKDNITFLKLEGQISHQKFKINTRVETYTSTVTFVDIDGGWVDVDNLFMSNGAIPGQVVETNTTAKIKNKGFVRFTDSRLFSRFVLEGFVAGITSTYNNEDALEFVHCDFISKDNQVNNYPEIFVVKTDGSIVDQATAYSQAYAFKKVIVRDLVLTSSGGSVLPISWGGLSRENYLRDLASPSGGKIVLPINKVRLPPFMLIKSIKLIQYQEYLPNVNKVRLEFSDTVSTAVEHTIDIDLSTYVNNSNVLNGFITVPKQKTLRIFYMLDSTEVTDIAKKPSAYLQIEYANIMGSPETDNLTTCRALTLV